MSKKLPDLSELSTSVNIANYLNDDTLSSIGSRVVEEYESDLESTRDWRDTYESALKIAKQVKETKTFPWTNAANVKYPLIAMAAIQFAARAYPEIIQSGKVAGCKVIGRDTDGSKQKRADRVSMHMSYQLTDDMTNWDEDTDRMLHVLPIAGLCWKKTYQDSTSGVRSDFLLPTDVVVHYHTRSLETAPRITHIFPLYQNAVIEHQRTGEYLADVELGMPNDVDNESQSNQEKPHIFLEQHRWWDLDGDSYQEPYIVTVHKDTRKVVRIVANYTADTILMHEGVVLRITPLQYFTKYSFIPASDGSFYDIGFGVLMNPLNETINSLINQLLDSGTLSNSGGGFLGKGARLPGGKLTFKPGEWKPVDVGGAQLKDAIVPLPVREPSAVLFNMLSLLIDVTKQLSTVSDEMTGDRTSNTETATSTLARLEQGMKMFNAIHKRIYRSLTKELKKIYNLNRQYVSQNDYSNIVDDPEADVKADYEDASVDVRPIADPNMTTDIQRMMRAQAVSQLVAMVPGANIVEAARRMLESLHVADIDKLLPDENAPPPPNPEALKAQAAMAEAQARLQMETMSKQAELHLKQQEMQQKMELDKQKAQIELQMKMEYAKTDEDLKRRKMEYDQSELEFNIKKASAELELKLKEAQDRLDLDAQIKDNEMRFKEYSFDAEKNHQITLKSMDNDAVEKNKGHGEDMKKTTEILKELIAKQSAPKKIIRDEYGKITHIQTAGEEPKELARDGEGRITHIVENDEITED